MVSQAAADCHKTRDYLFEGGDRKKSLKFHWNLHICIFATGWHSFLLALLNRPRSLSDGVEVENVYLAALSLTEWE